jgi:hypothetical protein
MVEPPVQTKTQIQDIEIAKRALETLRNVQTCYGVFIDWGTILRSMIYAEWIAYPEIGEDGSEERAYIMLASGISFKATYSKNDCYLQVCYGSKCHTAYV